MNPREIFEGSDGTATQGLYDKLQTFGAIGVIALNLFRACKCSGRAKVYRGRGHRGDAYDRKNWSLENLNKALLEHAETLGLKWGWGKDDTQPVHDKVLYVDLPTGQVSFHSATNFNSPQGYRGKWDGTHKSNNRIIRFTELVLHSQECPRVMDATHAFRLATQAHQEAIMGYVGIATGQKCPKCLDGVTALTLSGLCVACAIVEFGTPEPIVTESLL